MRNRHMRKPAELLLVPMIDIFTVLVTFLLMTAVFSRITVVELDLPSAADGPAVTEPPFRLEVILREEGFELTNGSSVIAAVPKVGGKYDLKALSEMARVSSDRVIVVDNLFLDERAEEADCLRDPSHVRNYTEREWRELFESAGLRIEEVQRLPKQIEVEPWLERAGTPETDAERVRELLADRIEVGWITLDRIAILGRKR